MNNTEFDVNRRRMAWVPEEFAATDQEEDEPTVEELLERAGKVPLDSREDPKP